MESGPAFVCMRCLRYDTTFRRLHTRMLTTTATKRQLHQTKRMPTTTGPPKTEPLVIDNLAIHSFQESAPPTFPQLHHATNFFTSAKGPQLLFSSSVFRTVPASTHPEVAFLGRSNVGKSSLLNAIFGRKGHSVAHVSKKPGRTQSINGWGIGGPIERIAPETEAWKGMGAGGVVCVDMPGYGAGSHEKWGREIVKYLRGRKQYVHSQSIHVSLVLVLVHRMEECHV